MVRKPKTTAFWWGRLPHWEVENGRYFVTMHLAGAIPDQGNERIRAIAAELRRIENPGDDQRLAIHRRIFEEMEEWLDRAAVVTYLQQPEVATMVMEAIQFRQTRVWNMLEFVVMPTHMHLFFEIGDRSLKRVLEQFKRWTGHEAGKVLGLDGSRFWQDEWFDHWSRSDEEDDRIAKYIRRNPEKAKLVKSYSEWPYGSWRGVQVGPARSGPE
jgi:REP element-mobilizing transposase RayT